MWRPFATPHLSPATNQTSRRLEGEAARNQAPEKAFKGRGMVAGMSDNMPGNNPTKPKAKNLSEADQYHQAPVIGSTADYFANRLNEQKKGRFD